MTYTMKTDNTTFTLSALEDLFNQGLETGFFSHIDIHFARFVRGFSGNVNPNVVLAAILLSRHTREGHICLDLAEHASKPVLPSSQSGSTLECPGLDEWIEDLRACDACGMPGDYSPLILDVFSRLYLWRYWNYEQNCAGRLLSLSSQIKVFDASLVKKGLEKVFHSGDDEGTEEQKLCALAALRGGLCVITGGPGTGKTTLVSKILSLLLYQDRSLRVALAAPTGKAARRVGEAVSETIQLLDLPDETKASLSGKASTIHRLLGIVPSRSTPRYHEKNPLPYDVIVIDEASMVDLALMAKLLQAIKPSARLILLGDKNQLASVQAGHVLGDMCDTGAVHGYSQEFASAAREMMGFDLVTGEPAGMQDSVVELKKTYRFTPDSGICQLSRCVNEGDADSCVEIMRSGEYKDIRVHETLPQGQASMDLRTEIVQAYAPYLRGTDPGQSLDMFNSFRVLCALREGPFGVEQMNTLIEQALAAQGLIKPAAQHYHGRPILITTNDYTLRLFNGDVGIILFDHKEKGLRAFFPAPEGALRKVSPMRLPQHETAFAMTVHKSQGSEFDHVLLMLPDRDSPVLSRELIYTGITRAMSRLDLCITPDVFAAAVARRTKRTSGLRDLLWGHR